MTLIETTTKGDQLYNPVTELEKLMNDLNLVNVFEDIWGTSPADYDPPTNEEQPQEIEAITQTLKEADEKYELTEVMKDNTYYIRVKQLVSESNTDISGVFDGDIPTQEAFDIAFAVLEIARDRYNEEGLKHEAEAVNDAHHWLQEYQGLLVKEEGEIPVANRTQTENETDPAFISAENISGIIDQLGVTGDELKATLTPEEREKVLEDYNNRIVNIPNFEGEKQVETFEDVPGELNGDPSFLIANIDRPFISLVKDALNNREEDYLQVPEEINPRTEYAYIEMGR